MRFVDFLKKHTKKDTMIGDLARDWMVRPTKKTISSRSELINYLNCCGACEAAIHAGKYAWKEYKRALARCV